MPQITFTRFLLILGAGVLLVNFLSRPTLDTTPFLTLPGTARAIVPVGEDLYITYRSLPQGSPHVALDEKDYSEIVKIPAANFLSGKSRPESVARVQGAIMGAALAHDQKSLYFNLRKMGEHGTESYLCTFDLTTHAISQVTPFSGFTNCLMDIDGKYLVDYDNVYARVSLDKGITWHSVLGDKAGERSVTYANGDIYYMFDKKIVKVPQSAIQDGSFQETYICTLAPDIKAGHIFVDEEEQIYVTVDQNRKPLLFNVTSRQLLPLSKRQVDKSYMVVETLFKHGDSFYCSFWAADRPMTKDSKIIKVTGDTILETEAYASPPDFLGAIGDYLVFNHDKVFARKSHVFGIKYK